LAQEPNWAGRRNVATGDGRRPIVNENGSVVLFPDGFALTAGQKVYIEADHFQGGGGGNYSLTYVVDPVDPTVPPADGTAETPASQFMQMRFAPNCPGSGEPCGGTIFTKLCDVEVTIAQEPSSLCEGQEVTFTAQVDGTPCYSYQWLKNGQVIPGATGSSYTTSSEANGDVYTVRVSNAFSSTDASITVVVLPNPCVLSCNAHCEINTIHIFWNKPVHLDGTYAVAGVALSNKRYGSSQSEVLLDMDGSQTPETDYTVVITGVTDLAGDVQFPAEIDCLFHYGWLIPNSTDFGRFCADFSFGLPLGTAVFGNNGFAYADASGVVHLTDSPVTGAYGVLAIPDQLSGGNLDALHVQWKSLFGNPTSGGADGFSFNWGPDLPNSPPFFGEGGIGTGLSVTIDTFNNGGGEVGLGIKWAGAQTTDLATGNPSFTRVGDGSTAANAFFMKNAFVDADLKVTSAGHVSFTYDGLNVQGDIPGWTGITIPPGQNWAFMFGARTGGAAENCWIDDVCINGRSDGPPVIISGPDDITVLEGDPAVFDVSVDGFRPLSYQWKSNGVAIAGANSATYRTPPTTPLASYNGTHWSVMVSNDCGMVTSKVATLTVLPSPKVVSCAARCERDGKWRVHVLYSKPVKLDGTYTIDPGALPAVSKAYGGGPSEVVLDLPPIALDMTYMLTIQDVHDQSVPPNVLVPNPTVCSFHNGFGAFCADFSILPDGTTNMPAGSVLTGSAYIGDDGTGNTVLHLTDAINSQNGNFFIPDQLGGSPLDRLHAHWRSLTGGGTGGGADGWSFNWAPDLSGTSSGGEEGAGTGLSVTVDTFNNGFPDIVGLEIGWKGVDLASLPLPKDASPAGIRKGVFVDDDLTVTPGGFVTWNHDGNILTATLPGFGAGIAGGGFLFAARTGGANDNQWIDDLCINVDPCLCNPFTIVRDPNDPTHNGLVIQWCFPGRLQCTQELGPNANWQDVTDPATGQPVPSPYLIPNPAKGARFYRTASP